MPRMTAIAGEHEPQLVRGKPLERDLPHRPARVSVAELAHLVEHRVRGRVPHLVDDATVGEEHDAARVRGRDRDRG